MINSIQDEIARSVKATASNLRSAEYPCFTSGEFLELYPQFASVVPSAVLEMYVEQARNCIQRSRWKAQWKSAMGLYIAHWLTMWLWGSAPEGSPAAVVANNGMSHGSVSSKSVDGVNVSYGQTSAASSLSGWGSYKDTLFGQQFLTMARIIGHGGMYVI